MSYSASRITEIFGAGRHSAAVTAAEAEKLARNPQALAERVYGLGNPRKARELGNTRAGDGYFFRGNGLLQSTGGGLHKELTEVLGVDFYSQPALMTAPQHALKPACHFWKTRNINPLADANDIGAVTRKVNGGTTGLADRRDYFNKIWAIMKAGQPVVASLKCDPEVQELQRNLNTLGLADPPLVEDGKFGKKTEDAIRLFQKMNGLKVDGDPGPSTRASVKQRLSATRSEAPPPEPLLTKENITFASGIGGSIMASVTSGPVQWALAGIMVVAFGVGLYFFIKNRRGIVL